MQVVIAGRVLLQEYLGEPDGAERPGNAVRHAAVFAGDDLGAAAADIADQDALPGLRPARI